MCNQTILQQKKHSSVLGSRKTARSPFLNSKSLHLALACGIKVDLKVRTIKFQAHSSIPLKEWIWTIIWIRVIPSIRVHKGRKSTLHTQIYLLKLHQARLNTIYPNCWIRKANRLVQPFPMRRIGLYRTTREYYLKAMMFQGQAGMIRVILMKCWSKSELFFE